MAGSRCPLSCRRYSSSGSWAMLSASRVTQFCRMGRASAVSGVTVTPELLRPLPIRPRQKLLPPSDTVPVLPPSTLEKNMLSLLWTAMRRGPCRPGGPRPAARRRRRSGQPECESWPPRPPAGRSPAGRTARTEPAVSYANAFFVDGCAACLGDLAADAGGDDGGHDAVDAADGLGLVHLAVARRVRHGHRVAGVPGQHRVAVVAQALDRRGIARYQLVVSGLQGDFRRLGR